MTTKNSSAIQRKSRSSSVLSRLRRRFRYGLATQEVLNRLTAATGIVVRPYFLVLEQLDPEGKPTGYDEAYVVRYLTEDDVDEMRITSVHPLSAEGFVARLRGGSKGIGLFVDGDLAAYTWYSLDCTPIPQRMGELFRLRTNEAYLFDTYVPQAYRGRRLAPLVRFRAYEELQKLGRDQFYSITLAFNASSRRFKERLRAREVELRLLIGFKAWRCLDVRLRVFGDPPRTPRRLSLVRPQADATATS